MHRDLKPENILIDSAGRVKVADFGLARLSLSAADSVAGRLPDAESHARESLESAVELGDAWLTASTEASLGFVAEQRRDHQTALRHYRSSLRRRIELGDVGGQGELLERIGVVVHDLRQDGLAVRLLGAEQALQRRATFVSRCSTWLLRRPWRSFAPGWAPKRSSASWTTARRPNGPTCCGLP